MGNEDKKTAAEPKGFFMAKGKCLTTLAGIKADGDKIEDGVLKDSVRAEWVKKGFIIKK